VRASGTPLQQNHASYGYTYTWNVKQKAVIDANGNPGTGSARRLSGVAHAFGLSIERSCCIAARRAGRSSVMPAPDPLTCFPVFRGREFKKL
jgi:hypothetical protein